MTTDAVTIRELTIQEIRSFLARNHVGRIAYSFHDRVDIRPIHYVYSDNWIFGRTSHSEKLDMLRHNQWVAFEVDEVKGPFDWMSVVAHGSFYRLSDESMPQNSELRDEALRLIRSFTPFALRETDPVPYRNELFAIALDKLTGRAASTG